MSEVAHFADGDWTGLRRALNKLAYNRLSPNSTPLFTGLKLKGLTDDSVIFVDNDGVLSENNSDLNWDDINKILTLVDTIQVKDSSGDIVMFSDDTQFYITSSVAIPIADGMPIGLLLALTYKT
jgi:hypothetical protein